MGRRKDAERYFAESLRAQPLRPEVETDCTRICDENREQRGRSEIMCALAFYAALALLAAIASLL